MPRLTDHEKSMLDGREGKARQKAMELLVRYAEALGAERFVDTTNVAGVPGQASVFLHNYYKDKVSADDPGSEYDAIFSFFDLDSDELLDVPRATTPTCHLQGGYDPEHWEELGAPAEAARVARESERYAVEHGVEILKTCTPYIVGNVPQRGEHCAWMESSAVIYCNSVLGAKTNTEGRESTSAAMLTGKIPDFGLHQDARRRATRHVIVDVDVATVMDWGMLGYFVGDRVGETIPVLTGRFADPGLVRLKHFGAAAASSGGVEMYHLERVTPEAPDFATATGGHPPREIFHYGPAERRAVYEALNANAACRDVDYVMLGCPHAALEQIEEVCRLLEGQRISANCRLWIFTSRAVRRQADAAGYTRIVREAGGTIFTDTCSAIGRVMPPGTRVAALDSAKQVHYLPAMMGIEAWFGSTRECIEAALTGRWNGELE
jgi:predicted aconitase